MHTSARRLAAGQHRHALRHVPAPVWSVDETIQAAAKRGDMPLPDALLERLHKLAALPVPADKDALHALREELAPLIALINSLRVTHAKAPEVEYTALLPTRPAAEPTDPPKGNDAMDRAILEERATKRVRDGFLVAP